MTQELPFYKYSGCGNDFVLMWRGGITTSALTSLVKRLCHRHEGVGADGVLLLEEKGGVDAYVRNFNADGSEAALCGNGLRCVVRFLNEDEGLVRHSYTLETASGIYSARIIEDGTVEVQLGVSSALLGPHRSELLPSLPLYTITVGVPHAVILCPNVEEVDVVRTGRELRYSPFFAPEGANINFATLLDAKKVALRTYERGVEGETLACGSGGAATAIAIAVHYGLSAPLKVITRHGSTLHYSFELYDSKAENLTMRGPAHRCFSGLYRCREAAAELSMT